MEIAIGKSRPLRFFIRVLPIVLACLTALLSILKFSPVDASAHSGHIFGPACGAAILDGNVGDSESSNASKLTFQMFNPGVGTPFTATLYVMNSGSTCTSESRSTTMNSVLRELSCLKAMVFASTSITTIAALYLRYTTMFSVFMPPCLSLRIVTLTESRFLLPARPM